jgi:N-acetyl-anhydromuramyl-L-alanine amidase AmpD
VSGTNGETLIKIPERFGDGGLHTKNFVGRPSKPEPVSGMVQGKDLVQYDFTPEQYKALIKLTATLCQVFPKIKCDCPRDEEGDVLMEKLPDEELAQYQGVLGHFHIQTDKIDPGPAFQWERVITKARHLLSNGLSDAADEASKGHMRPKF